ncbi:hypothetical protein KPL70_014631 [Citrus sinensis]|nr:hypothetical protein KPL70_014631 [Citrus sinensis]
MVGIPNSLVNLNVSYCEKIEEIIGHVGEEAKENRIAFNELKFLELDDLPRLTSFCLENYTLEFPSLERVFVTRCPNMKTFSQGIVSTPKLHEVQVSKKEEDELHHWEGNKLNSTIQKRYEEMIGFRDIERLQLSHFPRLKEIWHGQALPVSFFNNLFKLVVDDCANMSSAIPANLLRCLSNLRWLEVRNCDSLEEVLHLEELNADKEHIGPLFPRLFILRLIDLPKLKRFCNFTGNIIEMPMLWSLTIENCPDMETFISNSIGFRDIKYLQLSHFPRLQEIWHGQALPVSFFNNLAQLVVDDCTNMSSAIPANLLWCLNNLAWLEVRNCDSLEEVLHLEELSADKEHIGPLFPKLSELRLIDLPKLKRFCNFTGNIIELPKLEYLIIENCPDMETFTSNSTFVLYMTTDNKEAQKLKSEENLLVANQIHLFDEKCSISGRKMPNPTKCLQT